MRKYSKETFVKDLSDVIWMQVEMCENDDEAWATFNSSDCINDYVTDTRELSERSQVNFARREK